MVPGAAGDVNQVPLGGLDVLAVDMKDHPAFAPDKISRLVQGFLVAVNLVPVAALAGEGEQLEKLRRKDIRVPVSCSLSGTLSDGSSKIFRRM